MPETAHCDPCTKVEVLFTSLIPDPRTLATNKNYVVPGIVWDNKIGEKLVSTGHTSVSVGVSVGASVRNGKDNCIQLALTLKLALTLALSLASWMKSLVDRLETALFDVGVNLSR